MSILLRSLCLSLSLVSFLAFAQPIKVAVSVKPLHLLVQTLGGDKIQAPTLLIQEGLSPHDASLRPSEVKAINYADLIIWIGPGFETCLTPYMTMPHKQLTLVNTDLSFLEVRPEHAHTHNHGEEHASHEDHDGHEHASPSVPAPTYVDKSRQARLNYIKKIETVETNSEKAMHADPHIWLDPILMKEVASKITDALIKKAPEHTAYFKSNLTIVQSRLDILHKQLKLGFSEVSHEPFMVFHDSYRYLAKQYKLNLLESMNFNPHLPLSGKKIAGIKKQIEAYEVHCLFTDTETHQNTTLFNEFGVKTPLLDPLGDKSLPKGIEGYVMLMERLSKTMCQCLAPTPQPALEPASTSPDSSEPPAIHPLVTPGKGAVL